MGGDGDVSIQMDTHSNFKNYYVYEPSPILQKSSPCEIISFGFNIDLESKIQEGFLMSFSITCQLIFLKASHSVNIKIASESEAICS